jgi:hypothetical protein
VRLQNIWKKVYGIKMDQINLLKSKGILVTELKSKREELRIRGKKYSPNILASLKKEKYTLINIYGMYSALKKYPA